MGYGGGTFMRPSGTTSNDPALKVAQQKMQILEQDVILDEIGSGVDRLHGRALMINEETTLQTDLLNDMDLDVDKATMGLRQESKHANKIREQAGNCYLYICIAALLGILILLL